MSQRLALAMVFTFGASHPGVQSLALATLCVLFAVTSGMLAPLRDRSAQALHTVLLLGLSVVALCGVPFASDQERAVGGSGSGSATLQHVAEDVAVVFGTVGPALAATAAVVGPRLWTVVQSWGRRM